MIESTHSFKLVDGSFDPAEAKNILFALFNSKINFHGMEAFAIVERSGGDTSMHENRIKELSKANREAMHLIDLALEKKQKLRIDGVITIHLVNE